MSLSRRRQITISIGKAFSLSAKIRVAISAIERMS